MLRKPGRARDKKAVEAVREGWGPAERTTPAPLRDYGADRSICSYRLDDKEQILPNPFATRRRRVARAPIAAPRRGGRARPSHGRHLWRHVASATPDAGDISASPRPPPDGQQGRRGGVRVASGVRSDEDVRVADGSPSDRNGPGGDSTITRPHPRRWTGGHGRRHPRPAPCHFDNRSICSYCR
jgi:hypothetical protein